MKNSATILLLLFLSGPLLAQPVTITVSNTNGDASAGSLGSAVTAINANAGGGAITLTVPAASSISLTQPLSVLTQNVTLRGNSVTLTNTGGMDTKVLSQTNFNLDSGVSFNMTGVIGATGSNGGLVTVGGVGGTGYGSAVTATNLTLGSSSYLNGVGGTGGTGGNSLSYLGGQGGQGGDGAVTVGVLYLQTGALVTLGGGKGGTGGTGVIGGDGGSGGTGQVAAASATMDTGSFLKVTGGTGGLGGPGGTVGGIGGTGFVTIGSLQMNGTASVSVVGGVGGNGFINVRGGSGVAALGSVNMASGVFFSVMGGAGAPGLYVGPGGDAFVTIGSLTLGGGATFRVTGADGSSGSSGGDVGAVFGSVTMAAGDSLGFAGGIGNNNGDTGVTIASLNGAGSVSMSGGFSYLDIQSGNFSGILSGNEVLQKDGSGALTLTGSNLYTGSTVLKGGTLVFASTANLGTSSTLFYLDGGAAKITSTILTGKDAVLFSNGGDIDTNGNVLCIGGVVSGIGGFNKVGSGALTLLGNNTYSGGTTFTGGIIDVGADNNLGTGDLTFNGGILQLTAGFNTNKAVSVTSNGGVFDTNSFDMAVTGVVSGAGGLTKAGTGTLTLGGVSTYTGLATVSGGIFMVGDLNHATAQILGGVDVSAAGATLTGHGTIGGAVNNSLGTVQPGGDSIGTLSVGSFTQGPGGTLVLEVAPGQTSHLIVTGTASLDGTLNVLEDAGNYGIRYKYVFLTSGGATSGTFSTLMDNLSYMDTALDYGSNSVTLTLIRNNADFTAFANGANELSVGTALNASIPTATDAFVDKLNKIYEMPSGQSEVLSQLGGVIYTALPNVLLDHIQFQNDLLFSRLNQAGGAGGRQARSFPAGDLLFAQVPGLTSPPQAGLPQTDGAAPAAGLNSNRTKGIWVRSMDSFGSVRATADVPGFNQSNLGVLAGYDAEFAKGFTAGLMGGYLHTEVTALDKNAKTAVEGYQGGFYGSGRFGDFEIALVGGFGIDKFQTDRAITLGMDYNQMTGKTDGNHITGALQLDYRITRAGFLVKPLIGAKYAHLTVQSVTETGSTSLALSIPQGNYDSIRPYAGLNASKVFRLGDKDQLIPQIEFSASEELMNTQAQFQTALNGAPTNSFVITGITPDKTVLGVGAGLDFVMGQLDLFANYNGHFSGSQSLHTVNGGVNLAF